MSPRRFVRLLPRLWANWVTLLGSAIASVAGVALTLFVIVDLIAPGKNAYTGTLIIVTLPLLLVIGLGMIPVGLWLDRRRRPAGALSPVEAAFETALHDRTARNRIIFLAVATLANVALIGWAAQASMHYMDSPSFCGGACHSVMQPEWDAFRRSPHANVDCVECHIGSSSYVKAKFNGIGQMWKVSTHTYHTPITMPVSKLLSSKQTCERCHSQRYVGNRLKIYPHFKADKDNTPAFNVFMLHVGGPNPRTGKYDGAHWHSNPDLEVRYQYLDEARTKIGTIDVYEKHKLVASYLAPGPPQKATGERTMDCVDCHNRPTHVFDASAKDAMDRAIDTGLVDRKLPFIAQVGAELLARPDAARNGADAFFQKELGESYRREHPEVALVGHQLDASAKALAELYRLNVYPAMKLGIGGYHNNLGHGGDAGVGGCFRCHDKQHTAKLANGTEKTLGQDCDGCHERMAMGENPAKLDDTTQLALPKSNSP